MRQKKRDQRKAEQIVQVEDPAQLIEQAASDELEDNGTLGEKIEGSSNDAWWAQV